MAHEISNSDDVIDSRDVIARIETLRDEIEAAETVLCEELVAEGATEAEAKDAIASKIGGPDDVLTEERDELAVLESLQGEAEGYAPDWTYGATLIRDSYFVDYCQELCADIGDVPKEMPGYLVIDWEATADNLRVDYTEVEFDGVKYWVR